MLPKPPHFPAKAKRVIHLFMAGGPSQLDLFDYKPELVKWEGKPLPASVQKLYTTTTALSPALPMRR